MYIIQTNTSIINGNPVDFQSMMYEIKKQTWSEFKDYILSNEKFTNKIINGTMTGSTKPLNSKVIETFVDDDFHLEVVFEKKENDFKINSKYYKIDENSLGFILCN